VGSIGVGQVEIRRAIEIGFGHAQALEPGRRPELAGQVEQRRAGLQSSTFNARQMRDSVGAADWF